MGNRALAGWALLSAGLLALAFPTADLWPLAFVALAPLLVAAAAARPTRALAVGTLAGTTFAPAILWWLTVAMAEFGGIARPTSALLLLLLAVYVGAYVGAFAAGWAWSARLPPVARLLFAAALWTALEYLRAQLFTGFPWGFLAYTQYRNIPLIQMAAWTGMYGVSFLVVLTNVALGLLILHRRAWTTAAGVGLVGLGALGAALGLPRLAHRPSEGPALRVAIVQGNIPQDVKWSPAWRLRTSETYGRLTLEAARTAPALIVWPETALPFILSRDEGVREWLGRLAAEARTFVLVGAPDVSVASPTRYTNSAFLVAPDGWIAGRYDKVHLVPFGEYVPLRRLFFFMDKLAQGAVGNFLPGEAQAVLASPGFHVGATISYEIYFPNEVRGFILRGADLLANITNDAWYGRTAAPYQHLAMAVFRAVENRAYLVRAANTGVSAIIAPDGRIVDQSKIFTEAILTGEVRLRPRAAFLTPYTRYGDVFAWIALAGAAVAPGALAAARRLRGPTDRKSGGESRRPTAA